MNAWHRVIDARSTPARLLAATTAPNMINLVRNLDFIFIVPTRSKTAIATPKIFLNRIWISSPIRCAA